MPGARRVVTGQGHYCQRGMAVRRKRKLSAKAAEARPEDGMNPDNQQCYHTPTKVQPKAYFVAVGPKGCILSLERPAT